MPYLNNLTLLTLDGTSKLYASNSLVDGYIVPSDITENNLTHTLKTQYDAAEANPTAATPAQLLTGTDTSLVSLSVANLVSAIGTHTPNSAQATELLAGIARVATPTEMLLATADDRIVTPLKLAGVFQSNQKLHISGDFIQASGVTQIESTDSGDTWDSIGDTESSTWAGPISSLQTFTGGVLEIISTSGTASGTPSDSANVATLDMTVDFINMRIQGVAHANRGFGASSVETFYINTPITAGLNAYPFTYHTGTASVEIPSIEVNGTLQTVTALPHVKPSGADGLRSRMIFTITHKPIG